MCALRFKFFNNSCFKYLNEYNLSKRFTTKDVKIQIKNANVNVPKSSGSIPEKGAITATVKGDKPITSPEDLLVKPEPMLVGTSETKVLSTSVPFNEVPGPKLLQQLAKLLHFIPVIGNQVTANTVQYMLGANKLLGSQLSWGRNAFLFRWLLDEYGPVVRLQGPFGGDVVILSRPEDALAVFTSEGRYPIRSSLDCLEKYRLHYRKYKHAGPFLMHGEDWEKLRSQIMTSLHNSVIYQFNKIESTSNNFILRINQIKNRQDEVPATFGEELCKWSLESLCAVMLGQKVGFMNEKEHISTSESARLLHAFHAATHAIRKCESGLHLWKFAETPAWKALVKNCDTIDSIFTKYIREAEDNLRDRNKDILMSLSKDNIPLLEVMMLQEGMYPEDILTVFLDMMIIGVNATNHSLAFLLYHLARCPRAQRILADEVKTAPQVFHIQDLSKMKYLQACIKESLRLKPPIPFLSRVLTRDIVVHNYRIPKDTVVIMATYLSSVREEYFDDAYKFIPERWLNTELYGDSSFACIPFGFGPKACLAKNLAEMQLSILLIKLLRNFKIEYHYGNINSTNKMLASPNKPLKFRFLNRLN